MVEYSQERLWIARSRRDRLLVAAGLVAVVQVRAEDLVGVAAWWGARRIVVVRQTASESAWPGPWDLRFAERVLAACGGSAVRLLDVVVASASGRASVRRERPDLPWPKALPFADRGGLLC